jgi:hypothetical protein
MSHDQIPSAPSMTETVEAAEPATEPGPVPPAPPTEPGPVPPANTALKPWWRRWLLPVGIAFVVGVGIGATAQTDPTESAEFIELQDSLTEAEDRADTAEAEVDRAEQGAAEVQASYDELVAKVNDIETREADVKAREAAVTEAEAQAEANSVTEGVWVVGVDIKPGTYRAQGVSSDCYWSITSTGSNGGDIIDNDIPGGGNPQVTLEEGQDFETSRCGDWTLVE